METIKNYLESMFANLANTPEVIRAKDELLQMMEDKYNELKEEGMSENAAVGTVIAEFGNLDELSEDLGIQNFVAPQPQHNRRMVTKEEVVNYLRDTSKHAFLISFGVFLCIICSCCPILSDTFLSTDALGLFGFFLCIGVAITLFVTSPFRKQKWSFLKKEACFTDYATTQYIEEKKEHDRSTQAFSLSIGILFCVLSPLPAIMLDEFKMEKLVDAAGALFLLMVGVGVMLIVLSNMMKNSYKTLLSLNDRTTISGNYVSEKNQEPEYKNPTANTFMSLYWTTVTCLYLIVSFLTFNWHITWIIWPVAGLVHHLLSNIFEKK